MRKKGGRPKQENVKETTVSFRVTQGEKDKLTEEAATYGYHNRGQYLYDRCFTEHSKADFRHKAERTFNKEALLALGKLTYEVKKIGTNINQIAAIQNKNKGGSLGNDDKQVLQNARERLDELLAIIQEIDLL